MALSRQNASLAVYKTFMSFTPVSNSILADGKVFALARADAWIAAVNEVLVEKMAFGGRRHKDYTNNFAKFLSMTTSQLVGSICQFAQY